MNNETPERLQFILDTVREHSPITMKPLSRKSEQVLTRCAVYFFAKSYTTYPLEEIGRLFSKNHATVLNAIGKHTSYYRFFVFYTRLINEAYPELRTRFKKEIPDLAGTTHFNAVDDDEEEETNTEAPALFIDLRDELDFLTTQNKEYKEKIKKLNKIKELAPKMMGLIEQLDDKGIEEVITTRLEPFVRMYQSKVTHQDIINQRKAG